MNTTHTIGPWHVSTIPGHVGIEDENDKYIAKIYPHRVVHPTDKRRSMTREHDAEDMANARLIAAAPDMLRTLEFILADLNSTLDPETRLIIQATIDTATKGNA